MMRHEHCNERRNLTASNVNASLTANEYYPSVLSANSNDVMNLVSVHIHMTCMRAEQRRRRGGGDHMPSSFFLFFLSLISLSLVRHQQQQQQQLSKSMCGIGWKIQHHFSFYSLSSISTVIDYSRERECACLLASSSSSSSSLFSLYNRVSSARNNSFLVYFYFKVCFLTMGNNRFPPYCFRYSLLIFKSSLMAGKNLLSKSMPKQMSDSWIVIEDQDESDFVVIDKPQSSPQGKRPLGQNNKPSEVTTINNPTNGKSQNKKRKWKVLYSLPSTGVQGNVNSANLDSFVMDQHAQLFDKRDLLSSQQRIIKVK